MSALLGGFRLTSAGWIGPQSLRVQFVSIYTDRFHQLYLGRTLIGVSASLAARAVVGNAQSSHWPEELQLAAVTADDRLTDFGAILPPRPYNRVNLGWTVAGWTDAESIEITSGDAPGQANDPANLLCRVPFDVNRAYDYITPPLAGSGTWNFAIAGRDGTKPLGNLGTALDVAQAIDAHPPDVLLNGDGTRLAPSIAGGVLSIGFAYDW